MEYQKHVLCMKESGWYKYALPTPLPSLAVSYVWRSTSTIKSNWEGSTQSSMVSWTRCRSVTSSGRISWVISLSWGMRKPHSQDWSPMSSRSTRKGLMSLILLTEHWWESWRQQWPKKHLRSLWALIPLCLINTQIKWTSFSKMPMNYGKIRSSDS